jgi:hypothetical protein
MQSRRATRDQESDCRRVRVAAVAALVAAAFTLTAAAESGAAGAPDVAPALSSGTFAAAAIGSSSDSCSSAAVPLRLMGVRLARDEAAGAVAAANPGTTIGVSCALPYQRGKPGSDCTGWHQIVFSTTGTTPQAKVTAELLALDVNGNIIQALPVKNGDGAQLASRLSPNDFKMSTRPVGHEVFAPVPMLRVIVEDHGQRAEAYCSNIPYLQVVEPVNQVVTESDGNVTNVRAAIPLVHGPSLDVKVDGVNIFDAAHLNIPDPTICSPQSPCEGTTTINGANVTISNIVVDVAAAIGNLSSNTLRMSLEGLGCGGHVFVVNGTQLPGTLRDPTSSTCHIDDLRDKGFSSVFAIDITSPFPGEITTAVPTPVIGEVCGGRQIMSVKLNGLDANLAGQTCIPGDGENTGDVCKVAINAALGQTDLAQDIQFGDAPLGTFDIGSNRLVAAAIDDIGTRTYKRVLFAVGNNIVAPGVDIQAVLEQQSLSQAVQDGVADMILPSIQNAMNLTTTEIDNAFVVGLSAAGTQKQFTKLCTEPNPKADSPTFGKTAGEVFRDAVRSAILATPAIQKSISGGCSCDPRVTIAVNDVIIDPEDIACPVAFETGKFKVTVELPDVTVKASATGQCQTDACVLDACVCIARTTVNVQSTTTISNIRLEFDVTEDNLLNFTTSPQVYVKGTSSVATTGGSDVDCVASVCNWAIEGLVTILTFGTVDLDLSPSIDIRNTQDFTTQIGAAEPDPVRLNEIKVDEEVVAEFDQKMSGNVTSVKITQHGIVAGLKGSFATIAVDPEVESTPGLQLSPAPVPTLPVPNAQDLFIGLSDDALNMMFASMTIAGKLNTTCNATGKTVGDILPDCDTLTGETEGGTAVARGACYGVRGINCETLAFADPLHTATAQGICHAYQGNNCNEIPLGPGLVAAATEKAVCNNTPSPNLHASQPLLFCARQDVPPRMLLTDNPATSPVEASLRLNDLAVAMIVDRNGDSTLDGVLADLPTCFANGVPNNGDCNLFGACMDLNLNFEMQFQTCDGRPGFRNQFINLQILNREPGVVCSGSSATADDSTLLTQASTDETVTIDLTNRATEFAPPVCGAGMDLGGFVACDNPALFTIDAGGSTAFRDYIAITCQVQ